MEEQARPSLAQIADRHRDDEPAGLDRQPQHRLVNPLANRTKMFSLSCTRPRTPMATIAGMNVSDRTNAATSAKMTVIAIG